MKKNPIDSAKHPLLLPIRTLTYACSVLAAIASLSFNPLSLAAENKDAAFNDTESEVVFFGFDDRAFPFQHNVETHLTIGQHPQIVLRPGPPGSHDETILYYGTVIRIGDTFHMWYNGNHGPFRPINGFERKYCVLAYATSKDGVNWVKPELGLVEFNGSKANNIVDFPEPFLWSSATVIYDPEAADASRRFKIAYEAAAYEGAPILFCVAFSPDGLHWTPSAKNPVGPFLEMAGATMRDGLYYINGQDGFTAHHQTSVRRLTTYVSSDFEKWSSSAALGFDRGPDLSGPTAEGRLQKYEEVHLGAALWDRGNVIVGLYGQWHGTPTGDRRMTAIDIGLVLSHDALHFYEPVHGFRAVLAREQPESPIGVAPALQQGQGMVNLGEKTLFWYSLWRGNYGSGVRLITWERDRLGALQAYAPTNAEAISSTVEVLDPNAEAFINASGLGEHSRLRVELLDEGFHPIPGYSEADAAVIATNGFRQTIQWPGGAKLPTTAGLLRFRMLFDGVRPEDVRFHALYITGVKVQ